MVLPCTYTYASVTRALFTPCSYVVVDHGRGAARPGGQHALLRNCIAALAIVGVDLGRIELASATFAVSLSDRLHW